MFADKVLAITGGTGSFGRALLERAITEGFGEIRIFSRDENKQDLLRHEFSGQNIRYFIGDVRDYESLEDCFRGVNCVFHAAALKQVPSCEFYPLEALKTNVLGTENVIRAAKSSDVSNLVCLSTDKAVYPINAMGLSKALMEKVMISSSRNLSNDKLVVCGTRYGNVMASRGSVIPLFIKQILANEPITITSPEMSRFVMSLDEAIELVLFAFQNARNGDIFVKKSSSSKITDLAQALANIFDKPDHPVVFLGVRHGEKLYESLLSGEERLIAADMGQYFRVSADHRDLNYKNFVDEGVPSLENALKGADYNSKNSEQLSVSELELLLRQLPYIKRVLAECVGT